MHGAAHWWWKQACGLGEETASAFGYGGRSRLHRFGFRLGLDENQAREVARILDDLATERAQASVDRRRMAGSLADALAADSFDAAQAAEAAGLGVQAAERMRQARVRALDRLHRVLRPDQRALAAHLLRTGMFPL
jgi:Spy/CpxP family protein refolding chaperone